MEHLRIDFQISPLVADQGTIEQAIYHYVYVRGRCSFIELFPLFARKKGFIPTVESLLARRLLTTDLNSIWAREKQVVFTETPLSIPEDTMDPIIRLLNEQVHCVGKNFNHASSIYINRDFQMQWYKMTMKPGDHFHLGHHNDFRGRLYPKGHILTYQGTDFQKSLIRSQPYTLEA